MIKKLWMIYIFQTHKGAWFIGNNDKKIYGLQKSWLFSSGGVNLFIYQAIVQPGASRISDSPVSAENVIYEAFVFCGT